MVKNSKKSQGLTLIELMVSLAIGLFVSLAMVSYLTMTLKASSLQKSDKLTSDNAQRALSILTNAVHEAGSGNPAVSNLPFFPGECGSRTKCTDEGGSDPDHMAVVKVAIDGRDCTGAAVSMGTRIANLYWLEEQDGISSLFCRGFNLDLNGWIATSTPLADGIEDLQFQYYYIDGSSGQYMSADLIPSVDGSIELGWDRVRAVGISLLANTADDGPEASQRFNTSAIVMSKMGLVP